MQKTKNEELGRKSVAEFKSAQKIPLIVVLDNVRSALNIGSIFRTADAFLIEAVYLCGITAVPPNKEILKTALGATETVLWKYFQETYLAVEELKSIGYKIISIEQATGSQMLDRFFPVEGERYAVIFGHEVNGVQQSIVSSSDFCIEIPQWGHKHSLNIAVSAGIALWDLSVKIKNFESR